MRKLDYFQYAPPPKRRNGHEIATWKIVVTVLAILSWICAIAAIFGEAPPKRY